MPWLKRKMNVHCKKPKKRCNFRISFGFSLKGNFKSINKQSELKHLSSFGKKINREIVSSGERTRLIEN